MSRIGKKFLLLILAGALVLPAAACGSGAAAPGTPGNGSGSSGSGGEGYQYEEDVPSYGEAIERAREAADMAEQKQREIEENLEEAAGY